MAQDLTGADYFANPYSLLNRRREETPVFWSPKLRRWVLTRYDDVAAVLRDTERFSSNVAPQIPPHERVAALDDFVNLSAQWLFFLDPPAHAPQRALVARHFTPRAAQEMAQFIRETAHELIENKSQTANLKPQFDLISDFAHPLAARVIAGFLCASGRREQFLSWCRDIEAASLASRDRAARQRGFQAIIAATDYLKQNATELPLPRRILETAREANLESVTAHSLVLLFAGVETTQNLIGNLFHALLNNPLQWELLRAKPELAGRAVEEALRFDAPVLGVVRRVVNDTELGGVKLRRGDEMAVMIGAANRDPRYFNSPDNYNLHRKDGAAQLAFGQGRHYCVGAALSRLTAQIALEELLAGRPHLRFAPQEVMKWRDHDPIVRGLKKLWLLT
jgi:hypothetical protein